MSPPFRGLVATKNPAKNIHKSKCREGEIDATFNSYLITLSALIKFEKPMLVYEEYFNTYLFTLSALIKFEKPMLVYEEYFNTGVSVYISYITISSFATAASPWPLQIPPWEVDGLFLEIVLAHMVDRKKYLECEEYCCMADGLEFDVPNKKIENLNK